MVAWRFNKPATGPIIAEEPSIGWSEDTFALYEDNECYWYWFGTSPYAAFNATVHCLGEPPRTGACCDLAAPGGLLCREVLSTECWGPLARFSVGASCADPDTFDPPCGTSACCQWWDTCDDFTEIECDAFDGLWHPGEFCNDPDLQCEDFSRCLLAGWGSPCCLDVCGFDPYCRDYEWDGVCEALAYELCCAVEAVGWLDPPDGVVDARQPHPLDNADDLWGIDTILVEAVTGDDRKCWSFCETNDRGYGPNAIDRVTDHDDGTFTITLDRPITPGAVTMLSYALDRDSASFTSHPANVDGDSAASPVDILALIDFLNDVAPLPWGLYSCDMDHCGQCALADILRLIDLLNGAGAFEPWNGTVLPENPGICP
jgi:hypothetical protein